MFTAISSGLCEARGRDGRVPHGAGSGQIPRAARAAIGGRQIEVDLAPLIPGSQRPPVRRRENPAVNSA